MQKKDERTDGAPEQGEIGRVVVGALTMLEVDDRQRMMGLGAPSVLSSA